MSERPSFSELTRKPEDPRRDLLIEAPKQLDHPDIAREFERQVAAQLFPVEIRPTPQGRTLIVVKVPPYDQGLYLPESSNRKEWENWHDESNPAYERNTEAGIALTEALSRRQPLKRNFTLDQARVALGTIYRFPYGETGDNAVAIRVNNDWGRNIYAGWGNTYSSLTKVLRRGSHPVDLAHASIEEVIPADIDEEHGITPYFPEKGFFRAGNHQRYKSKVLKITGQSPHSPYVDMDRSVEAEFVQDSYDTGIDLVYDFSALGDTRLRQMKNVNPLLTPQGTLEIQTVLDIGTPQLLLDPEYGSDILVVTTEGLTDWAHHVQRKGQAELDGLTVIDGSTGLPTTDQLKVDGYRQDFKASPPLWAVIRRLYEQRLREDS